MVDSKLFDYSCGGSSGFKITVLVKLSPDSLLSQLKQKRENRTEVKVTSAIPWRQ